MKVLFAVNNEDVSESIIKLYQKEYKEIIFGKNVYYFNAIIKELQRDPTYDRIIISEDLEPNTGNNYNIINKQLFDELDRISDEAISDNGTDIPIIFIATDRRSRSDELLSKLFSIGIYDALLGKDRSIPEVCKLLNKPRTKREAKIYYRIETEEVSYQSETEDSVSEKEIQNILIHYKKLGKDTEKYVQSFDNIAEQYTDAQLRVITKFLPIGVKAVLETESPKYQAIMTFGEGTYENIAKAKKKEVKQDLKIGFIETNNEKAKLTKPVVIPSAVNIKSAKKVVSETIQEEPKKEEAQTNIELNEENAIEGADIPILIDTPVKKKRGRPKKEVPPEEAIKIPKKRGRPKKIITEVESEIDNTLMPEIESTQNNESYISYGTPVIRKQPIEEAPNLFNLSNNFANSNNTASDETQIERTKPLYYEDADLTRLLTRDKKIVSFIGTAKAGTSFLINSLADMISLSGIKTAILDLTENRNSYYIYTKNDESLRRIASNSIEKLEGGIVEGIDVNKNLSVFTAIPNQKIDIRNTTQILSNLIKKYSLVLIDCDFKTPYEYFKASGEIYLVQTMDILTIQPLTAFLRDLQSSNILEPSKLRIVINKSIRVRGLTSKILVGGMSCYNNPEMSYMRELFDKDKIQSITIPFDEDTLSRYLSGIVDCYVRTSEYPKLFLMALKKLQEYVYPLVESKKTTYGRK